MNNITVAQLFEGFYIMRPKYVALWKLIDDYDKKHVANNYPYQTVEVEHILRVTYGLMGATKETALNKIYLEKIGSLCDKINIETPDSKQIDELKDAIHHLYELGFPNKSGQPC